MRKNLFKPRRSPEQVLKELRRQSERMPLLARYGEAQRDRLARTARDFLRRKTIEGAGGLDVDADMRTIVALQAALPVLNLGVDLYSGWYSVILYPSEFRAPYEFHDPSGLVHHGSRDLSGEAWHRGPVVLAWDRVELDAYDPEPDGNLVVHELAHKLDLLNGSVNGMPPLHRDMAPADWSRVMSGAYEDLNRHLDEGREPPIDPYAAESPGEFFAVVAELFLAWPQLLAEVYPEVYRQLASYFRQDPLAA